MAKGNNQFQTRKQHFENKKHVLNVNGKTFYVPQNNLKKIAGKAAFMKYKGGQTTQQSNVRANKEKVKIIIQKPKAKLKGATLKTKTKIIGGALTKGAIKVGETSYYLKQCKSEDGVSITGHAVDRALELSANKNISKAHEFKNIEKQANKELKAIKKEEKKDFKQAGKEGFSNRAEKKQFVKEKGDKASPVDAKKGLGVKEQKYKYQRATKTNRQGYEKNKNTASKESIFNTKNRNGDIVSAKAVFIRKNPQGTKPTDAFIKRNASETEYKKGIFNRKETRTIEKNSPIKTRNEQKEHAQKIKKAAKKAQNKEKTKAAAKRSAATVIQMRQAVARDIMSEPTGDIFADGQSPTLNLIKQKILARIKDSVSNFLKRLIRRIVITLAPYLAALAVILLIIIVVVSVIPGMDTDPEVAREIIPSGDGLYYHSYLDEETIALYLATARKELYVTNFVDPRGYTTPDPNKEEKETIPEENKAGIMTAIELALRSVGADYCQIHRLGIHSWNLNEPCYYAGDIINVDMPFIYHIMPAYDCSGLCWVSYMDGAGIDISYNGDSTAAGIASELTDQDKGLRGLKVLPGDLLFYGYGDNDRYLGIYHVALYIGAGKTVEALNVNAGVVLKDASKGESLIFIARPFYKERTDEEREDAMEDNADNYDEDN